MASGAEVEQKQDSLGENGPLGRAWIRTALVLGGELILASVGAVLALIWLQPQLALEPSDYFPGPLLPYPSDLNGTAWYYWWVHRALSQGKPLLYSELICAPQGEDLSQIFFSRLDALLAYPFFATFEFPASLNLTILFGVWLNILACWVLFRSLTGWRMLALALAVLVGYSAYTVGELAMGRPVSGLIFPIPLTLWAWWKVLHAQTPRAARGWGLVVGCAGALAVHLYIPFALFLGFGGLVLWGGVLLRPPPQASRRAGLWSLPTLCLSAILLAAPYFYEIQVLRPQMQGWKSGSEQPIPAMPSMLSVQFWSSLSLSPDRHPGFRPSNLSMAELKEYRLDRMQGRSLPVTWPWKRPMGEDNRRALLPSPLGYLVIGLVCWALGDGLVALLRKRRSGLALEPALPVQDPPGTSGPESVQTLEGSSPPVLRTADLPNAPLRTAHVWHPVGIWVLLVLLSYLLTLGPYAVWDVTDTKSWVTLGGQRVRLPLGWVIQLWPSLAEIVRPFRAFPVLYVALGAALSLGGEALRQSVSHQLERLRMASVGRGRRAWRVVPGLLAVTLAVGLPVWLARASLTEQTKKQKGLLPRIVPFYSAPIWKELAQSTPPDSILLELPIGRAYAYAIPQLTHGLRRSEGVQAMGVERLVMYQPDRCFNHPFQRAMWRLERELLQDKVLGAHLDPTLVPKAVEAGFSHVIVYPKAYTEHPWQWERLDPAPLIAELTRTLGSPWYQDDEVMVFGLQERRQEQLQEWHQPEKKDLPARSENPVAP